jgi:hypothetical protein
MDTMKQYLLSILPKYNRNSRISIINTGNNKINLVLSPQDQVGDTSIRQFVSNMRTLKGELSLEKAFNYILSNFATFKTNNAEDSKTSVIVLTPGDFDQSKATNMEDEFGDLKKNFDSAFTFVVIGDPYKTNEYIRPKLSGNDVIIEVKNPDELASSTDEVHTAITDSLSGK